MVECDSWICCSSMRSGYVGLPLRSPDYTPLTGSSAKLSAPLAGNNGL
jgi:hypothetical protein